MLRGTRRAYKHGDGERWMQFHLEERDGEDRPESMDRISVYKINKKEKEKKGCVKKNN